MKAFSTEEIETEKYFNVLQKMYKVGIKNGHLFSAGLAFFMNYIWFVFMGVVLYGSYLYKEGEMDVGEITAFILFTLQLIVSFMIMAGTISAYANIIGASGKMKAIFEEEPKIRYDGEEKPEEFNGKIEFEDIQFAYPSKAEIPVLDGISFTAEANKVIACVGKSGCGKSTIISLIERFYEGTGSIMIDGSDIKGLSKDWLKSQLSLVS